MKAILLILIMIIGILSLTGAAFGHIFLILFILAALIIISNIKNDLSDFKIEEDRKWKSRIKY